MEKLGKSSLKTFRSGYLGIAPIQINEEKLLPPEVEIKPDTSNESDLSKLQQKADENDLLLPMELNAPEFKRTFAPDGQINGVLLPIEFSVGINPQNTCMDCD